MDAITMKITPSTPGHQILADVTIIPFPLGSHATPLILNAQLKKTILETLGLSQVTTGSGLGQIGDSILLSSGAVSQMPVEIHTREQLNGNQSLSIYAVNPESFADPDLYLLHFPLTSSLVAAFASMGLPLPAGTADMYPTLDLPGIAITPLRDHLASLRCTNAEINEAMTPKTDRQLEAAQDHLSRVPDPTKAAALDSHRRETSRHLASHHSIFSDLLEQLHMHSALSIATFDYALTGCIAAAMNEQYALLHFLRAQVHHWALSGQAAALDLQAMLSDDLISTLNHYCCTPIFLHN
jgi:hypothetical protein